MDKLPFLYMNAAGWAKSVEQIRILAGVPNLTHIVAGSFTVNYREGNTGGTNFVCLDDGTTINALGLPNGGIPYLKSHGKVMTKIVHDAGKKLVVSGAWFSPEEAGILAETSFEIGADYFERNDGCPNVFDDGKRKEIASYNLELMHEANEAVLYAVGYNEPVWVKLSPYESREEREKVAKLYSESIVRAIVTCNTRPGRLLKSDRTPYITAKGTDGNGGIGGTSIKQSAEENARHFCRLLPKKWIIGVGGIANARDMEERLVVGCAGIQIASAFFWSENPKVLQDLGNEWANEYGPA